MHYDTALRGYTSKRIEEIEDADILVGIPCYNNESTIAHVIQMVTHGLAKHYKDQRSVILVADGGSTDDTREVAKEFQVKPWQEKIEIITKFMSDKNDNDHVTLDHFLTNGKMPDFIKIDVEGAEQKVLNGGINLLKLSKALKIVICTYHNQDDAEDFSKFFKDLRYSVNFTAGYMIFRRGIKRPYLRRGVLQAVK